MSERPLMQFNAGAGSLGPAKTWEEIAHELWALLDDIDTASDMFKPEQTGYYRYVLDSAKRRWRYACSDGYSLEFNVKSAE